MITGGPNVLYELNELYVCLYIDRGVAMDRKWQTL